MYGNAIDYSMTWMNMTTGCPPQSEVNCRKLRLRQSSNSGTQSDGIYRYPEWQVEGNEDI
ncbi:hypothetical protein T265_02939 [Opisthorchis viverrini]|uniref:Uncharacterized protein n=1 Tax=Opisthorchis viverrini TaxID=6198 RepID=A0A074ZTF3_OPIVI|nr:hypothetical protein T265_02939 [Opisthorchis viverrini]KER30703.1 hypothetical protein T265_02939 [Opisthorchis viverrini]